MSRLAEGLFFFLLFSWWPWPRTPQPLGFGEPDGPYGTFNHFGSAEYCCITQTWADDQVDEVISDIQCSIAQYNKPMVKLYLPEDPDGRFSAPISTHPSPCNNHPFETQRVHHSRLSKFSMSRISTWRCFRKGHRAGTRNALIILKHMVLYLIDISLMTYYDRDDSDEEICEILRFSSLCSYSAHFASFWC